METHQLNDSPRLDLFCRLCLLRKPHLRPLSDQIQAMTIPEMLFKVTGVLLNMNEPFPRVICERCLVKLELAHNISEEFRKQDVLLRKLLWKGALADELVEYQRSEQSRRKPYSEEVAERLTAVDSTIPLEEADFAEGFVIKQEPAPFEGELDIVKQEPIETTEFSIRVLPDDDEVDEGVEQPEWMWQTNEVIDNGLEMVLELEDLRTIGALPDELLEHLDTQSRTASSENSEEEHGDDEDEEDELSSIDSELHCKICNKSYKLQTDLDAHYLSRHKAGKKPWKYECKYCQQRFQRKPEQAVHEKVHENRIAAGLPDPNQGPYKCPICNRRYLHVSRYNQHVRRHEHVENGTFRCKVCSHPFASLSGLQRHERKHETEWRTARDNIPPPVLINQDAKTVFKCEECEHVFETRFRYFNHAQTHIIRKTGVLQCQECGKCYTNKKFLQHHQRKVHSLFIKSEPDEKETETPIEPAPPVEIEKKLPHCSECDAFFLYQVEFEIHMCVHGTLANQKALVNVKSEVTDEAGQQLEGAAAKVSLKATPVELTEPMPLGSVWKCDECGDSVKIRTDGTYRDHKRKHQRTRNTTLKCEVCKIAFSTSTELRRHRKSNHGLVSGRTLGDREDCPLCRKSVKKNVLQQHIKLHENLHLRKHVCSQCDSAYGTLNALRKHVAAGKCKEPGYIPRTPEALSMGVIQAFFKWVDQRRCPTGAELLPMIEEQDGLFKCKACGQTYKGFASVAYHVERHKVNVSREDQDLDVQSMSRKRPRNDYRSDSSDLELLE